MHNYTREDILEMVDEEDVGFIRLQFTDIFGTMKNMAVTVNQLEKVMNNQCMFDGSSIRGFLGPEESDTVSYTHLDVYKRQPQNKGRIFKRRTP